MKITNQEFIDNYCKKHADLYDTIKDWIDKIEAADWKTHNDLKATFPSADYVGNRRYVFNIKGNNYRLVAVVVFFEGTLKVRFIGTHAEYDKINKTKDISEI